MPWKHVLNTCKKIFFFLKTLSYKTKSINQEKQKNLIIILFILFTKENNLDMSVHHMISG